MENLNKIQQELKAPKNQFNKFGGYAYRSAEDILEAVKPLLKKHGSQLTISDSIEQVGDRIYVKATCTYTEGGEAISVSGYAREPAEKKGMDAPQITGTASSYARKYALNGLFLIDDTKDADTDEAYKQDGRAEQKSEKKSPAQDFASEYQIKKIKDLAKQAGTPLENIMQGYKIDDLHKLSAMAAGKTITTLEKRIKEKNNA